MPADDYVIKVLDMAGGTVLADLTASTLMLSKTLNAPGSAEFTLPISHADCTVANLPAGRRRIEIYSESLIVPGGYEVRWGGDLWNVDVDTASQSVRFGCLGHFERLRHREFAQNLYYKDVDQFEIAWGLIDYTQTLGDLGYTRDPEESPSGITRRRHYCAWEGGTIGDAISDLADNYDGFDFELSPTGIWRVWHDRRGITGRRSFSMGSAPTDATDIWEIRLTDDATTVANSIAGIPDDDCLDLSDIIVQENEDSITDYGLMQSTLDLPHQPHRADRRQAVLEELRIRKRSRKQVELRTPDLPWGPFPYEVGDTVYLTADLGYVAYSAEELRVMTWQVNVDENQEMSSVLLDSVVS